MLGGVLNNRCFGNVEERNLVLLGFSNSIYVFDKKEGTVVNKITVHEYPILHFVLKTKR